MKQVFVCRGVGTTGIGNPSFCNPVNADNWAYNTEGRVRCPWPVDGTFRNLKLVLDSPSATQTYTLRVNGVDTALTLTVTSPTTEAELTGVDVAVTAGDEVSLSCTESAGDLVHVSIEFESETSTLSAYGTSANSLVLDPTGSTRYNGLFKGASQWGGSDALNARNLTGVAGDITATYARVETAPGSGKSYTFQIHKNGVAQDGSGGTVDTRVVIADLNTTANGSFTLPVVVGDQVCISVVPSGTPTITYGQYGVAFDADDPYVSQFCGRTAQGLDNASAAYQEPANDGTGGAWTATEANVENAGGVTAFELRGLVVALTASPGSGKSYAFAGRLNGATPGAGPVVALENAETTDSDADGVLAIAPDDTFSLQEIPSGTPAGASASWAFGMYVAPPQIRGSAVFGESTTVTASRAIAFGLDGNTNTHSEEGKFKVFGAADITGAFRGGLHTVDPSAPEDNTFWLLYEAGSPGSVSLKVRIDGVTETLDSWSV